MNTNNLTPALIGAFNAAKEAIGRLQERDSVLDPEDCNAHTEEIQILGEVLEHLRTVDRGFPAPALNALPSDLDGPVRLEPRPTRMNFKMERHLSEYVWNFCRRSGCKPGQYFRLLTEKDMRLAANGTAKVQ